MKPLPLFAAFGLGLLSTFNSRADTLEQSLHSQLDDASKSEASIFYRISFASQRMHYTVPTTLASILESHTEAELVPALTALKSSVDANDALLVQDWIAIAKSHAHGAPSIVDVPSSSSVKHIQVVCYSIALFRHRP